jgi:hypothetical protein
MATQRCIVIVDTNLELFALPVILVEAIFFDEVKVCCRHTRTYLGTFHSNAQPRQLQLSTYLHFLLHD